MILHCSNISHTPDDPESGSPPSRYEKAYHLVVEVRRNILVIEENISSKELTISPFSKGMRTTETLLSFAKTSHPLNYITIPYII